MNETGTLDVGIASIVRKYKGREKMLILILMPLFALGGTTYGMGEETMASLSTSCTCYDVRWF